jgi:hypothetical protein
VYKSQRQGLSKPQASDEAEAEYRRSGTVALSAVRPRAEPIEEAEPPPPRRRRRVPGALIAVVILLAIVLAGAWTASRAVYFVGVDERSGAVTIYNGVPYELPLGIELYRHYYSSGVTLAQVPAPRRATFTNHKLRPKDDAENLVLQLENGEIEG